MPTDPASIPEHAIEAAKVQFGTRQPLDQVRAAIAAALDALMTNEPVWVTQRERMESAVVWPDHVLDEVLQREADRAD